MRTVSGFRWFISLTVCLSTLGAASGFAGQAPPAGEPSAPLTLTLDAALALAGDNSPEIKKALESRNANQGRYVEERAAAFPQLSASGLYDRSWDRSQEFMGVPSSTGVGSVGVTLNQALYTWGRIPAAIRAATLGLDLWKDNLAVARQTAIRDVTVVFHDVLLARELFSIAGQNLEQKERLLDEAKKKAAAGTATDFDVLAAEVSVQNARPEVIRTGNQIAVAREQLRFAIGIEGREVDVTGTLDAIVPADPPSYGQALGAALANRPELARLRRQMGMSEELVTIYAAGDKPTLALQAGAGWQTIWAGSADGEGFNGSAGIVLAWPFYDGGRTRGKVAGARSDLASLSIDESRLREAIVLQVREAVNAVKDSVETMNAIAGTVGLAERLLTMAEKGFAYGVKTRLDVDDASLNLKVARGNLAQARRNLAAARATLVWVMGGPA